MRVATIGVYGFTVETFRRSLLDAGAGLVVDVRQRRGVRGSDYAWANAQRLQAMLAEAGIDYRHDKELAPTTEMRRLQYAEDDRRGVGKRNRAELAPEYVRRYTDEILDHVDLAAFAASLPADTVSALLCVETDAPACHRSLIAARLEADYGAEITHLPPPRGPQGADATEV